MLRYVTSVRKELYLYSLSGKHSGLGTRPSVFLATTLLSLGMVTALSSSAPCSFGSAPCSGMQPAVLSSPLSHILWQQWRVGAGEGDTINSNQ